ncbi:MAG: glycoside hydrolase 100 family protein [Gammaproteobacteria bacterium]|nr:glycoside hydrolase 100 family protein [Gammaproteobacteria bacterium]
MTEHTKTAITKARALLEEAVVSYMGRPVGTVAALDPGLEALNYDQVFTRDFAVSAFALLLEGRDDIVRNFLELAVELQSSERQFDCFKPGQGLIPASFKVETVDAGQRLAADFGEHAIARVAPVDSGFWWLLTLQAYGRATGDTTLVRTPPFQEAIRLVLDLSLVTRFDMFPTMLVPDGSFMIDRRMGVYGYPIDIQAQFYAALCAARRLLVADEPANAEYVAAVEERLGHLAYHLRTYYWLDLERLNQVYRYGVEEYGPTAANQFNIQPEAIPDWLMDWLPEGGGYFAGNVGPGRLDYRFFAQGNLLASAAGLATPEQTAAIMALYAAHRDDLLGEMPLKLCFPALAGQEWRILTGCDPKNRPWSYHNGGNWPMLLWLFAIVALEAGDQELLETALHDAERRLVREDWPEYFDGRAGRLVGRYARRRQTWTAAGYLVARQLLEHPERAAWLRLGDHVDAASCST